MGLAFWRSPRWRGIFTIDDGRAEVEGLAAGTGLLTGPHVDENGVVDLACPRCERRGGANVEDVEGLTVARRCHLCGHAWTAGGHVGH